MNCITVNRRSSFRTQSFPDSIISPHFHHFPKICITLSFHLRISVAFLHTVSRKNSSSKPYFVHAHSAQHHDDNRRIRKTDSDDAQRRWRISAKLAPLKILPTCSNSYATSVDNTLSQAALKASRSGCPFSASCFI